MRVRNNGFTIVELLIVVVVIAILASITIVAYSGIRQNAESSAQKAELSQLQRKIQVDVLNTSGSPVDVKIPIVRATKTGSTTLVTPLQNAQEITLYGIFDTTNNPAGSNWSGIITMGPGVGGSNNLRLRTGANTESSVRAFYETSSASNRDLTRSGILNTTARHIGWITANSTTIISGIDTNADVSAALPAHTGWNFDSVTLVSGNGYNAVAAIVFPEYHDAATRAQMVQWLNKEYNVGL